MRLVGLAVAVLALASSAGAATPVRATMTASSAKPVVDQPWRWTVTVKSAAGKPLPAKMRLQILFGSTVVGCWKGTAMTQCSGANAGTWIGSCLMITEFSFCLVYHGFILHYFF